MATLIEGKGNQAGQFIEQDCTIKLDGKEFTSGGSWLCQNTKTGKLEGVLYASPKTNEVTSWDGKFRHDNYFKEKEQQLLALFGMEIKYARAYPKYLYANGEKVYEKKHSKKFTLRRAK